MGPCTRGAALISPMRREEAIDCAASMIAISSRRALRVRPEIKYSKEVSSPAQAGDPVTTWFRLSTAHDAVVTGCHAFAGHDSGAARGWFQSRLKISRSLQ